MTGELAGSAAELAAQLGLRASDLTLAHAEAAVELANLEPVPAPWLAGAAVPGQAIADVATRLEDEAAARERAQVFEPSVLDLDLEALQQRFVHEHRGLKKLGGAYRADRDALAATAPTVKPKAAIAAIGSALEWQRTRAALEAADKTPLADAWPETDAATLRAKGERARRAIELAGSRIADRARLSAQRRPSADRTDAACARLRAELPESLLPLLEHPLTRAAEELRTAAAQLDELAALTRRVDALRGRPGATGNAVDARRAANTVADLERRHASDHEAATALERWAALDIDADALQAAVAWAQETARLLPHPPGRAAAARLVTVTPDRTALDDALTRWDAARDTFLEEFAPDRRPEIRDDLEADFDDAQSLIARLEATRGDIETWIAHARATSDLEVAGLQSAVAFCRERHVSSNQLVDVLRRSALEALADRALADRADQLGPVRSVDRDRLVADYGRLDRQLVHDAAHRVMAAANARRPNAILGVAAIISPRGAEEDAGTCRSRTCWRRPRR